MASEDQLLAAAAAAKPFAAAGEEVVGVLVADPFEHGLVFLCALGPPADDDDDDADDVPELGWIAVDPRGLALADARRVQEAAMLAALCETAEEAALVPDAAEIAAAAERALGLAGEERPELRAALDATRDAARSQPPSTTTACASRAPATSTSWPTPHARSARARRRCSSAARSSRRASAAGRSTLPTRSRAPSGTCSSGSRRGRAGALQRRAGRRRAGASRRSPRTCWRTTAPTSTTRRPGMSSSTDAPS